MHQSELLSLWKHEEQQPFSGWDFSYLIGRVFEDDPPWSYMERAVQLMRGACSVIDLDTGGGERLLDLQADWPPTVVATEEYPPNFKLASERLTPLGVRVVDVRLTYHDPMPFADGEFDLVINRHSAFNPAEVARIISPGGTFLTQQVHGQYGADLMAIFGKTPQWPDSTLENYVSWLQAAGMTMVRAEEWKGRHRFRDVGALVYYLKAVPWTVPDFSVERYSSELLALHNKIEEEDELVFTSRKFLIEAKKDSVIS